MRWHHGVLLDAQLWWRNLLVTCYPSLCVGLHFILFCHAHPCATPCLPACTCRAQAEALLVREAQLRDMYHRALLAATGSDYTLAEEEEGLAEEGLTGEAQPEVVAEGQ